MHSTTANPQPLFERAAALHRQGRLREAEELYESILRCDGRHFESIYYLGSIRLQQNRSAEAEALFRRAVKINKRSADAQHQLANALTALQRPNEAVGHYRKALELKSRDAVVHNNLGYVLQTLGQHEEAARHYRKALAINPGYAEAYNNLGNVLQLLERSEEAIEKYRQALKLRPNYAVAHNNLASALAVLNRQEEAIEHGKKALAFAPKFAAAHLNLANSLGAVERPQEALQHYRQAIAIDPLNPEAYARAASMFFHIGQVQEAIAHCEKALSIKPDHVDALGYRGVALRALGKVNEAIESFEQAIAAAPKQAIRLYHNLATCKRISASDPHFAVMQQLATKMESFSVNNQIGLHFALGKAFADIEDHDQSFQHLLKGNALKRQEFVEYDEKHFLQRFERIAAAFTTGLMNDKRDRGHSSSTPVFIIGMPRSGTSLLEQILASHPDVFGAGERYGFRDLVLAIVGAEGAEFPEAVPNMSSEDLHALGVSYVQNVQALAPDAKRITDKMPGNFFYAGLIHLALPNARIIHVRRDPRDIAVSCFSTLFTVGHPQTYDLAELGRYIHAYEKLMEHWRRVLPQRAMIEVRYEELIGDLESQAKSIVEYCGLEWDDACLAFYKTSRPVRTASAVQVRQPIYSNSVGRWRLYEEQLEPFLHAFSGSESDAIGSGARDVR